VTFKRQDVDDAGERQVVVRLDDRASVTLYFGDEATEEVEPGEHRVRVHNTLVWKNLRFSIEPGQRVEFMIVNYAPRFTLGMLALVGAGPLFLRIRQQVLEQRPGAAAATEAPVT
jgi:hypothetical protein